MKWTKIETGQTHSAFQHFMVALGDEAETAVDRLNDDSDGFVNRLATFAINGGTEPTISQQKAREIMGKNMFGIEEAVRHFGISPTYGQLAVLSAIPFTEEELQQRKDTHVLVAVFPLSILEIREKVDDKRLFYDQDWYDGQAFAKEYGQVGWQLVQKTPVDNSTSKNWQEQLALVSEEDEVPIAQVMVYAIIGHCLATGERLFKCIYVRTSSVVSGGDRVHVGDFDSSGLYVNNDGGGSRDDDVAVSSARKF